MKATNQIIVLLFGIFSMTSIFANAAVHLENTLLHAQEPVPTIIELLQDGESFSIEITSLGCFHGTRQTLSVSRDQGVFKAHFKEDTFVITDKQVDAFINFELQLRALDLGGCTTVDTYVLQYGNEKFRTSDGTCSWNGGKKLLQQLGLV